jgi:hypothetical protein
MNVGIIVKNESQSPVGNSSKFVYDTLNVNTLAPVNVQDANARKTFMFHC